MRRGCSGAGQNDSRGVIHSSAGWKEKMILSFPRHLAAYGEKAMPPPRPRFSFHFIQIHMNCSKGDITIISGSLESNVFVSICFLKDKACV